ncbi:MAG: hypothetical protein RL153_1085 [Verrucomicrobiota bacterium]
MNHMFVGIVSASFAVVMAPLIALADKGLLPRRIDSNLGLLSISGSSSSIPIHGPHSLARPLPPRSGNYIAFEALTSDHSYNVASNLWALGARDCKSYPGIVTGVLPVDKIPDLAQLQGITFARATQSRSFAGSVFSQADAASSSPLARGRFLVSGAGKRVGIISDSFNYRAGMADGIASGDLPQAVDIVLEGSGEDEGRAMAEIVHDVAPGASIAFHAFGNGQHDLADAFLTLAGLAPGQASKRCQVIVDDVGFFAEPMFADGVIAQAVDAAAAAGVVVVSAAGNDNKNSFEDGPWRTSTVHGVRGFRHQFNSDISNPVTLLPITVGFGDTVFVLQWPDAYKSSAPDSPSNLGAFHDVDIYLHNPDGSYVMDSAGLRVASYNHNVGNDPVEILSIRSFADSASYALSIEYTENRLQGSSPPAGSLPLIKLIWSGNSSVGGFPSKTGKSSIFGHPNANSSIAIGAVAYYQTPPYGRIPVPQSFSSVGGTSIYVDSLGSPFPAPILRAKPDLCAPDGANTSFFAFDTDGDSAPNFVGTSAAAAAAAGTVALMLEANPSLSPAALEAVLRASATDMLSPGFDFDSGFGLLNAAAAVAAVSSPVPVRVGDLDANGCVGISDLALLQAALRSRSSDLRFDINKDGRVNLADARSLALLFSNPSGTCP